MCKVRVLLCSVLRGKVWFVCLYIMRKWLFCLLFESLLLLWSLKSECLVLVCIWTYAQYLARLHLLRPGPSSPHSVYLSLSLCLCLWVCIFLPLSVPGLPLALSVSLSLSLSLSLSHSQTNVRGLNEHDTWILLHKQFFCHGNKYYMSEDRCSYHVCFMLWFSCK